MMTTSAVVSNVESFSTTVMVTTIIEVEVADTTAKVGTEVIWVKTQNSDPNHNINRIVSLNN